MSIRPLIKKILPQSIIDYYRNYRENQKLEPYKGNAVTCNICGGHFNHFGARGVPLRQNAECYKCHSLERHRLLWAYLQAKTNFFDSAVRKTMLHFAPESFFLRKFSRIKGLEYVPCDLFPDYYKVENATTVVKVDITSIPFDDKFFDVIICNHVLEHIPDDVKAMKELFRVLNPGGWAIVQVPIDYARATTYEDFSITDPMEREKAFGQQDHVRWYGRDYPERLKKAGFEVSEDHFIESFSAEEKVRFGFMPHEIIYLVYKS